jgi:cytochrome b561
MSEPAISESAISHPAMSHPKGYSRTQIFLHWGVAALIVAQFVLHEPIAEAWDAIEDGLSVSFNPLVAAHVFGGIAILLLAIWRLFLRAARGVPAAPDSEPPVLRKAAHVAHLALYGLMLAMPISGIVAWFGGVEAAAEVHEAMKPALLILVALHVVATLWHQFWLRDGLLARMKHPAD